MKFVRIEDADRAHIDRALDEAFAKVAPKGTPRQFVSDSRRVITPKLAALIAERRSRGVTYATISRETGLLAATVRRHCIREGIR